MKNNYTLALIKTNNKKTKKNFMKPLMVINITNIIISKINIKIIAITTIIIEIITQKINFNNREKDITITITIKIIDIG
jgi:hypothetical protein